MKKNYTKKAFDLSNPLGVIFPAFGERSQLPFVFDPARRFFIYNEHVTIRGNRVYYGVRVSDNIVITELIGKQGTNLWMDGITLYYYDGFELKTGTSKLFTKEHYNDERVKEYITNLVTEYIEAQYKLIGLTVTQEIKTAQITNLIEGCYRSLLDDNSYNIIHEIIPHISINDKLIN